MKSKWNLKNTWQLVIILVVFALTGTTVLFLKRPVVAYFNPDGESNLVFSILYFILILPIYNVILLIYGFIFGQFSFFWSYEKKFFRRMFRRSESKISEEKPG